MKKELKISAIKEGTVIDHIPAYATFKVANILNLEEHDKILTIATNLLSKRYKKKGIIKIGGKFLTKKEVDKIAIIAPKATLNIIRNYEVKEKTDLSVPDSVIGIIKCSNPNCITNLERINTKFNVVSKDPLRVECCYCERNMAGEDIEIA